MLVLSGDPAQSDLQPQRLARHGFSPAPGHQKVSAVSKLLIDDHPLQVLPSLAVKVGLNEAIILQQIHYWLNTSKFEHDGVRWVYNTVKQWAEQFPFWSDDTIARALKHLRDSGILVAERLGENKFDKTLYYTIDYTLLQDSMDAKPGASIPAFCGNRRSQSASLSNKTETTTETTRDNNAGLAAVDDLAHGFDEFWAAWPASHRKADKQKCLARWKSQFLHKQADKIIASVISWKASADWKKDGGQFIPAPLVYLRRGSYDAAPPPRHGSQQKSFSEIDYRAGVDEDGNIIG